MKLIKQYNVKAKWQLHVDSVTGIGKAGYVNGYAYQRGVAAPRALPKGTNQLLHGELLMTGFSRGRSAANFDFKSRDGVWFDTGLWGAHELFKAVADGRMSSHHAEWGIPEKYCVDFSTQQYETRDALYSGAVFEGYWTFAKRGSQVFIVPAEKDLIP